MILEITNLITWNLYNNLLQFFFLNNNFDALNVDMHYSYLRSFILVLIHSWTLH